MAHILAIDIGTKRTGIAYLDEDIGIPLPLTTLHHTGTEDLLTQLSSLIEQRSIDRLVVGLPRLLSGGEGAQARYVREIAEQMQKRGWPLSFRDERYTTPRMPTTDPDAIAALNLL
ncbi:hypothetical protein AUJ46_05135 [Candidatus Peregrinibacteria bacterium CG1_02_54_53]|nr:MAG: hypothetical protein AUJ46_05135 [Candidatus Peregrinibacteria bacterium CG1_02_54_53]